MRNYKPKPLWKVILSDILAGALILGIVVFFRLGLPMLQARAASQAQQQESPAKSDVREPGQTSAPSPGADDAHAGSTAETDGAPEATPDPRTPWQIRFAEHFSEETVITDHSYRSPQVSITVETHTFGEGANQSVYHVADIYVASPDSFRTYTANNVLAPSTSQDAMEMDAASHAILAISGDFYAYQPQGFLVRNGQVYMDDQTYCDLCVLYNDGVMACYSRFDYKVEDILSRGVAQAWNFGPSLLDENGHVKASYEMPIPVSYPNPRSAVGYYEPGHYCFVVVDGRQDGYSKGMTMPELAQIFEELGCACAYNLDGGGSAVMTFLHERYSVQSNGGDRSLCDILLITEDGWEDKR